MARRRGRDSRGLITPVHTWGVDLQERELQPIFARPVFVGDSITNIEIDMWMAMESMYHSFRTPGVVMELNVVRIGASMLGEEYIDMILNDAEDVLSAGQLITGEPEATGTISTTDGGHLSGTALTTVRSVAAGDREYAGEIPGDVTNGQYAAAVAKWVSEGLWLSGRTFHDLDDIANDTRFDNVDMLFSKPVVAPHIRTMFANHIPTEFAGNVNTADMGGQSEIGATQSSARWSIARLIQRMSALGRAERTYIEYIRDGGGNPSFVGGIPERLMHRQHLCFPEDNFFPLLGVDGAVTDLSNDFHASKIQWKARGLSRRGNIMCHEPGLVLGYVTWYPFQMTESDYAHVMAMSQFKSAAHFGQPDDPGDEDGFVTLYQIDNQSDTGATEDQWGAATENGLRTGSLLNSYFYGDSFTNDIAKFSGFDNFDGGLESTVNATTIGMARFGQRTSMKV